MANIVHSSSGAQSIRVNIFCQSTEPHKKDGIWIETPKNVGIFDIETKKYFSQIGNFLGKTGYQSIVMNYDGYSSSSYYRFSDRFLWRPFVGETSIYFIGAEKYNNNDSMSQTERTHLTTFNKTNQTLNKTQIFSLGEGNNNSSEHAGTNAFEYNNHFYIYVYFHCTRSSGSVWKKGYLARCYDKKGNLIASSSEAEDSIPEDYFVIGTVRQELYALGAKTWISSDDPLVASKSLYKVVLDGFTPTFTYSSAVPDVYASQRTTAIYDNCFYFAKNNSLIEYNTTTKATNTFSFPTTFPNVPTVCTVGGQIFITDMTESQKHTYLFDIESKNFTSLSHNDTHAYDNSCLMCVDGNRLLIFPVDYKVKNKDNRDPADMDVTMFDVTKDVLKNHTVALEDNPLYDARLYTSTDNKLYLRGLFGNVWLYENDDYQEYPTYIGDGTSWRKVKN